MWLLQGTLPFMALAITHSGNKILHEPHHDLELFFYIFIWMCVHCAGPIQKHQNFDISNTGLKHWVTGSDLKTIAKQKFTDVANGIFFNENVLKFFAPYFVDMKPLTNKLREAIFKPSIFQTIPTTTDPITYDTMIALLQEVHVKLPNEDKWTPADDREGYGIKRKKDLVDQVTAVLSVNQGEVVTANSDPGCHTQRQMRTPHSMADSDLPRPDSSSRTLCRRPGVMKATSEPVTSQAYSLDALLSVRAHLAGEDRPVMRS